MAVKPKYWRKNNQTGTLNEEGKVATTETHASINKAKKRSRELQGSHRGTGILVLL